MKPIANAFEDPKTPIDEASKQMDRLITQHMTIPQTGSLTPRANIQHRVRTQIQPRQSILQKLRTRFQFRMPMYQAACGMAMACIVVFASSYILSSTHTQAPQAPQHGLGLLDSTAVLGAINQEVMRTTTSDSLGTMRFEMPDTFSNAVVDTL